MPRPRKANRAKSGGLGASGSSDPAGTPPKKSPRKPRGQNSGVSEGKEENNDTQASPQKEIEPVFLICDGEEEVLQTFMQLKKEEQIRILEISKEDIEELLGYNGIDIATNNGVNPLCNLQGTTPTGGQIVGCNAGPSCLQKLAKTSA